MKLPNATSDFSRAFSIARALSWPGLIPDDLQITGGPSNMLDVRIAQAAMNILTWSEDEIERKLIHAKAEFLADNAKQMAEIRKGLAKPKEVKAQPKNELLAKITISI